MEPWEESGEKHCFCRGCSRCRMSLSGRYTPKIKGNGVSSLRPRKKIACGALENSVFLRGRRCAPARPRPLTEERVARPPTGVGDPTWNMIFSSSFSTGRNAMSSVRRVDLALA